MEAVKVLQDALVSLVNPQFAQFKHLGAKGAPVGTRNYNEIASLLTTLPVSFTSDIQVLDTSDPNFGKFKSMLDNDPLDEAPLY